MDRKLTPALCERHGVMSHGKAIAFAYRVKGEVHNVKIRRGKGDMPWRDAGKPLILWNLDCLAAEAASDEEVIITEGEFDALAMIEAGFTRVVSVPNGAQAGENGFGFLYRDGKDGDLLPDLAKFGRYVIAADGDAKGIACRDALANRLGDENCRWLRYPDGCKDANEVLIHHGADKLRELVDNAPRMWTDEVATIDDIPDAAPEKTYAVGIHELDRYGFRITLPAFWPIIGPYGSGKSVLLRQVLVNLWRNHGWRALLTSFEEQVKPRYQRDLRRHFICRPDSEAAPWTSKEIAEADDEIRRGFVFMRRKRGCTFDMARALDRIEYAVRVYGVKVVAIDPFNKIRIRGDKGQSKSDAIGEFLTALKDLGEDYGLLTIVLAHPPKDSTDKRLAKNGILTLNDGEDSRHWGTDADIGWCVWRNLNGPTLLHIDKLKDHETMGQPTLAELTLNREMNRFAVSRMGFDILARKKEGE